MAELFMQDVCRQDVAALSVQDYLFQDYEMYVAGLFFKFVSALGFPLAAAATAAVAAVAAVGAVTTTTTTPTTDDG